MKPGTAHRRIRNRNRGSSRIGERHALRLRAPYGDAAESFAARIHCQLSIADARAGQRNICQRARRIAADRRRRAESSGRIRSKSQSQRFALPCRDRHR